MLGQCRDLCYYVEKFSGGDPKPFLQELDQWSKILSKRREVNSKQFHILSTAPIAHQPDYITACAKALFAAPKTFLRKEEAVIWDSTDVANMANAKKESVTEAVGIMRSCRKWASESGLSTEVNPKLVLAIGLLDVNLVHHVHGKKCRERASYTSMKEIGGAFVKQVQDEFALKTGAPSPPFEPFSAAAPSAKASGSVSAPMREYTIGGNVTAGTLGRSGVCTGKKCVLAADDQSTTVFAIVAVNDDGVSLRYLNQAGELQRQKKVACSEFMNLYKLKPDDDEPTYLSTGIPPADETFDAMSKFVESTVRVALHNAFVEQRSIYDNYALQVKPDKRVFAAQAAEKGAIVMLPYTTAVSIVKTAPLESAVSSPGAVHTDKHDRKYHCVFQKREVLPPDGDGASSAKVVDPFVVPYWAVRKVSNDSDATMKASTVKAGEITLPCYVMKKGVDAGTELTVVSRPAAGPQAVTAAKGVLVGGMGRADPKKRVAPKAPGKGGKGAKVAKRG